MKKKILFADGCVLREKSRTEQLAQAYLQKRLSSGDCILECVILEDTNLLPLDGSLLQQREQWIASGDFTSEYFRFAKAFAAADELVIAVPYWDMNFPSYLKIYLEHLCICNLTFRYSEQGLPVGLTNVRKLTYITTAGGFIGNRNFGYEYVKGLMEGLFCVPSIQLIYAEGLDLCGNDPQLIMDRAIQSLPD